MRAGYAEVIKYGLLGDPAFFDWCEANGAGVARRRPRARRPTPSTDERRAPRPRIVAEDERETTGARALLNLGHTFGHALEAETGFSDRLLHGEAVALGMVLAARYSARRGYISRRRRGAGHRRDRRRRPAERDRRARAQLQRRARSPAHMLHDKKMDAGTLPFVLLRGIGEAFLDKQVSLDDVAEFLDEELQAH